MKPKGYCSDTGQVCFAQAITTPQAIGGHPLWGALFETAVVNEIRKQASFLPSFPNIYHWRSHGGAECDLLLERILRVVCGGKVGLVYISIFAYCVKTVRKDGF